MRLFFTSYTSIEFAFFNSMAKNITLVLEMSSPKVFTSIWLFFFCQIDWIVFLPLQSITCRRHKHPNPSAENRDLIEMLLTTNCQLRSGNYGNRNSFVSGR